MLLHDAPGGCPWVPRHLARPSVTFDEFRRPKVDPGLSDSLTLNSALIFRVPPRLHSELRTTTREATRHPRATSRGIVQQHFPGPRSHSMNFAGLRSTQAFLTHLPRTQPPISVSHPACARSYGLRGSSLLSVVSPLKLKQLRS